MTDPNKDDFEPERTMTPTDLGIDPVAAHMHEDPTPLTAEQKSYSQGQLVRRRFLRHKGAMTSLVVLIFITLLAFTSIGIGPIPGWWDKDFTKAANIVNGGRPTLQFWPFQLGEHPFGQDSTGKDYFALVMRGTQVSLTIAFSVGIIATIIGTVIGGLAGYFRGWLENALMRLTDLFIVIPLLVLAAVLGQIAAGWGVAGLAVMLGLVTWTGLARLVRGEVLSLRRSKSVV